MKRDGAQKIYKQIKDMSPEEKTAYWRKRSEEFRRKWGNARRTKEAG